MTTIAVKDGIMAADSLGNGSDCRAKHKKVFRVNGALIGGCGQWQDLCTFVQWVHAGGDLKALPEFRMYRGADDAPNFTALVLDSDGLWLWSEHFQPFEIEDDFWAVGSGQAAALAAMHMGATAAEAVAVAAKVDCGTGGEIQAESLDPSRLMGIAI